jgi:hypothetical protein
MPGNWSIYGHPLLNDQTCRETSPAVRRYNCIAWAAEEDFRWWWPDPVGLSYWPANIARDESVPTFIMAFQTLGYELCDDGTLEEGLQKIALYGRAQASGDFVATHVSRQLPSGEWTSKMGPLEDICHQEPHHVSGPAYGQVVCFMSRKRSS